MKKKSLLLIFLTILLWNCANFVAPTGGEKDEKPPILIKSIPENQSKNFSGNEIQLYFDELIDGSAIYNELIIRPEPDGGFETKIKNNTVTIKFEENFKDSTTYTLNFGNSIKDLTEKNPSKNLSLVFSTYDKIDSLSILGIVKNINNKKPVLDATVALYTYDTLNISKQKPLYTIKTDSTGKYKIDNIKNGNYFLFAFKDNNRNNRYDQDSDLMGFLKDSLILNENKILDELEIYKADYKSNKQKRIIPRDKSFEILLEKKPLKIKMENPLDSNIISHTLNNDKIYFHKLTETNIDTVKSKILLVDSLLHVDTLVTNIYFRETTTRKRKTEILPVSSNIKNNQELNSQLNYKISFPTPVMKYDLNKIEFRTDSLLIEKPNIRFKNRYELEINIKTNAKEEVLLVIPSNTFENYLGDTNTLFTLRNPILNQEELGLIEGYVEDKQNHKIAVLTNLDTKTEIERQKFTEAFLFENLIPGNYNVTVIFDENNNGNWDPGNLTERRLPEKILSTKQALRVRANYELRGILIDE